MEVFALGVSDHRLTMKDVSDRPLLFLDLAPEHVQLRRLGAAFECVSTASLCGGRHGAKLPRVQKLSGARPMAWLVKDVPADAYRWAARRSKRGTPTLLMTPRGGAAVTGQDVDRLLKWSVRIMAGDGHLLDIGTTTDGPAGQLSNFSAHTFVFRGEQIASMEGLLQSLKCPDPDRQADMWQLTGIRAKNAGSEFRWADDQTLYWRGEPIDRHGYAYQDLLDEAYGAMFGQNLAALATLLATEELMLDHSIGRTDPRATILTVDEFCSRLERIRSELRSRSSG